MIRSAAAGEPARWELRAAACAAGAEAGLFALPASVIVGDVHGAGGLLSFLAVFASIYVAGTVLICRYRASPSVNTAAAIVAIAAGLAAGGGGLDARAESVVGALVVALRLVTLGLRDWRDPIRESFVLGAVALGVEAIVAAGPRPDWSPALAVVVPAFFIGSLASRATTVWATGDADQVPEETRSAWIRRAVRASAGAAAAILVAAALGLRGGILDRLGSVIVPVGNVVASVFVWFLAQLSRPIFWLADRLHIDEDRARRLLARIRSGVGRARRDAVRNIGQPSLLGRLVGFLLLASVVAAGLWLIRRQRARAGAVASAPTAATDAGVSTKPLPGPSPAPSRRARRELPTDTVRRWYAEALYALAARDLAKDPASTPAEYELRVGRELPVCAEGFRALTRAYEDVRYGGARIEGGGLRNLAVHRRAVMRAIRGSPRPERLEGGEGAP